MGKNYVMVLSNLGYLSGIIDADYEVAKKVAKRYNVSAYRNVEDADFDAAVIATPTVTHYQLAREIIERGKHVLVEKPFTHNIEGVEC